MFKPSDPTSLAFMDLCETVAAGGPDRLAAEIRATACLPGLAVDRSLVQAAINSGSTRIFKATHTCCAPRDWARLIPRQHQNFVTSRLNLPDNVCQTAPLDLFDAMASAGLSDLLVDRLPRFVLLRDDPSLRDFMLEMTHLTHNRLFGRALMEFPTGSETTQVIDLADDVLYHIDHILDDRPADLDPLMQTFCQKNLFRFAGLLLCTGRDFSDMSHIACTPGLSELVALSASAHGRLTLARAEPDRRNLLGRADDAIFFGKRLS